MQFCACGASSGARGSAIASVNDFSTSPSGDVLCASDPITLADARPLGARGAGGVASGPPGPLETIVGFARTTRGAASAETDKTSTTVIATNARMAVGSAGRAQNY